MARSASVIVLGALLLLSPQRSDADVMWDYFVIGTSCIGGTCRQVTTGDDYVATPELARVAVSQANAFGASSGEAWMTAITETPTMTGSHRARHSLSFDHHGSRLSSYSVSHQTTKKSFVYTNPFLPFGSYVAEVFYSITLDIREWGEANAFAFVGVSMDGAFGANDHYAGYDRTIRTPVINAASRTIQSGQSWDMLFITSTMIGSNAAIRSTDCRVSLCFGPGTSRGAGGGFIDSSHSAELLGVLLRDLHGNVITEGLLTTDGVPVTLLTAPPVAPVPEATSMSLLAIAAAFGAGRYRRLRPRSVSPSAGC